MGDLGSVPGLGRSPREGNSYQQHECVSGRYLIKIERENINWYQGTGWLRMISMSRGCEKSLPPVTVAPHPHPQLTLGISTHRVFCIQVILRGSTLPGGLRRWYLRVVRVCPPGCVFRGERRSIHAWFLLWLFTCSVVSDSATPWTAAHQASLSFTIS